MGKTRKVSRGYTTGFVPDYRHVMETQAESQHFEDSFAPKRKHGTVDSDCFGVPSRLLSISNISRLEKKDLELTLTNELEKVRMLQNKLDSFSYENVSHRPVVPESLFKANLVTHGKKKGATGRNGPRTKGGVMQVPSCNVNIGPLMKQCETLLTRLMKHQHGWIFNEPVDVVKLKIPDYFTVIKQPMDLGTVKKKLVSSQYTHPTEFTEDVRLTFSNALKYNPVGHDVHSMAGVLSEFFEVRWKPIEKKTPVMVDEYVPSRSSVVFEPQVEQVIPPKKQKITYVENAMKQETNQMVMSDVEKKKLSEELEAYLEELPESIIEFLKQSSLDGSQASEDEIEIDIDIMRDDTLFTLRKLMDDFIIEKQRNQAKQGPCEIEMGSVSGFSNLSAQPHKENEAVDEDVDIGGDDPPPISSSSPIEIDKDVTRRNSSSSSSSSESGSSSSDTDSGNSMPGELDGVKNSVPLDATNDAIDCKLEQTENDHGAANKDSSAGGHLEQSPTNSSLIEPSCRQEGENAPTERQVSPDKLYRAALLRSRYADIIIKAQENTNDKGERPNPEKLKLEREELEKRRKEEKSRLQAEAKAAEAARKKAEEEAAMEVKKKREVEREAARLALQQMEKTVEINESSQFMEGLEIFKSAPEKHLLQSFIEEASPNENSRDCIGSFKFESSANPLEQLGLYMKNDEDEDDEEVELQSIPDGGGASKDPEEGEID